MKTKAKDQLDVFMFVLTIVIAILIIMFIAMNIGNLQMYFGKNKQVNDLQVNSTQIGDIAKLGLRLEKDKLKYVASTTILTTKLTNNGTVKENIRFRTRFISYDGKIISEAIGYIGMIKANETKYIDSYITDDISGLSKIKYEIIE